MLGTPVLKGHRRYILVVNGSWKYYWHLVGGGDVHLLWEAGVLDRIKLFHINFS